MNVIEASQTYSTSMMQQQMNELNQSFCYIKSGH